MDDLATVSRRANADIIVLVSQLIAKCRYYEFCFSLNHIQCMSCSQALLWLTITSTGFADWALTPPGDPHRNWATAVTVRGVYDDNFNTSATDRQSGFRLGSDIRLRAKVPIQRLFIALDYDYAVDYPRDIRLGGINQTHNANLTVNYVFTPRLALGLSETFIKSLEPQLVQGPAAAPVTIVQAGNYIFDKADATISYALTPRWSLFARSSGHAGVEH